MTQLTDRCPWHCCWWSPDVNPSAQEKKGHHSMMWTVLSAGMLEAHTYAAGCLRLLSLDEDNKSHIMGAGAPRYISHLLDCKQDLPRWHARQTLLNLAMVPSYACVLALYDIPNFVTGSNVPSVSPGRPKTAPATLEGKSLDCATLPCRQPSATPGMSGDTCSLPYKFCKPHCVAKL